MAEYIDRKALIEHLEKDPLYDLVEQYGVTGVIESFPSADVQPVKHGQWVFNKPSDDWIMSLYTCDQCGHLEEGKQNYCPNCGAKMRSE